MIKEAQIKNLPTRFIQPNHQEFAWNKTDEIIRYWKYLAMICSNLAAGVDFNSLGLQIDDPVLLDIPSPVGIKNGWEGEILRVYHFGNLESNIHLRLLQGAKISKIQCCSAIFDGLVQTFGDASPGDMVAMIDSSGVISICQVNGSAARKLIVAQEPGLK